MQRVAIYARVSTQEQAENGNSLEFQIDKLKAYCQLHEYKIVGEYVDAGVSGAKSERPALNKLKKDIDKIDIVLIYKLDRLSRSIKDTMYLIEDLFKPNNVNLISLSENFDTSQAMGMATIGMLSTFAQLERETIKERMMAGKIQAVKNGKNINKTPFGYIKKDGQLIKDERTKDCVDFIFKKMLEGKSLHETVKLLEMSEYNNLRKWSFVFINRMTKNKVYCGHTESLGEIIKNTHDNYINDKEYKYINELLLERKTHSSKSQRNKLPAIFRGLISCPNCNRKLTPFTRKRKNGDKTMYYRCNNCASEGKKTISITEKVFEKKLLNFLKYDFKIEFKKTKIEKKDYSKILNNLENKKFKLQKAWLNELLTDRELEKLQNEVNEQIKSIKAEEQEYNLMVEDSEKQSNITGIVSNFESLYLTMNVDEKIEFLNTIIKNIVTEETVKKVNIYDKHTINIVDIIFR
jgi:integrase|nr:MAG TPA: integrase [Caudoviricetes sp.]